MHQWLRLVFSVVGSFNHPLVDGVCRLCSAARRSHEADERFPFSASHPSLTSPSMGSDWNLCCVFIDILRSGSLQPACVLSTGFSIPGVCVPLHVVFQGN